MILITFLIAIFSICEAPELKIGYIERENVIKPFEAIWQAVCQVESYNNPLAINVKEQAYGIVQIRQIRLDDYIKQTGRFALLKDMYNPEMSKEIFMFFARKHYYSDLENIAKDWNGSGKQTEKYWQKVKKYL
jgi:hypothetical protein